MNTSLSILNLTHIAKTGINMPLENDFYISMISYFRCLTYLIFLSIILVIFTVILDQPYGLVLLGYLFIGIPAIIIGSAYYLRYLYIHILLCRTYYALKNKPRFYLLIFLLVLFLFPITAMVYGLVSPFIIYFLVSITDKNKVQENLNLKDSNDFYNFKKLRKALLEEMKKST